MLIDLFSSSLVTGLEEEGEEDVVRDELTVSLTRKNHL